MPDLPQSSTRNGLLAALSPDDSDLLRPSLERVSLQSREVLIEANKPVEHVYFIEEGLSSTVVADGHAEIGMVGREGCVGVCVLLGADQSPHQTFMQIGGEALRIAAKPLQLAMDRSPSLRTMLLRYAHVFLIQTGQTAHANARYVIEERLARWILMACDRLEGEGVSLTHELLALMLGVRRPGVTNALHVLEGARIIRASRGHLTVLDRSRLAKLAGDSYGLPEAEYKRLIG